MKWKEWKIAYAAEMLGVDYKELLESFERQSKVKNLKRKAIVHAYGITHYNNSTRDVLD